MSDRLNAGYDTTVRPERTAPESNGARPGFRAGAARGFTLIELLIAMACVAILVSIAVPSYNFAVVKARRGAAQACLTEAAQFMERWYTTQMTYAGAPNPTCANDVAGHYAIAFDGVPDATSYTIEIDPQGSQATAEDKCGTMTINQVGQKTGATADCWR
jgi:type IV pilus assembly protein PilE